MNQINNQLSIASRLGDDFERFYEYTLFFTDGMQSPLQEARAIYRDYRGSLENLRARANTLLDGQRNPIASDSLLMRTELTAICEGVLERLTPLRTQLAALESTEARNAITSMNGDTEQGRVPSTKGDDGRLLDTEAGPLLNQEETNGQPPAKG